MYLSRVQLFIVTKIGYILLPILVLFGLFILGNDTFIDNME